MFSGESVGQGRAALGKTRRGSLSEESVVWAVEDRASQLYISKRIVVGEVLCFFKSFIRLFVCYYYYYFIIVI